MYPSKPNSNPGAYNQDTSETSKLTAQTSATESKYGPPQPGNPSAPLLPSTPYNPHVPNMEPPPYSSVVAQDSSDWKNRSSSFSGGTNLQPYPPAASHINPSKSTSGLDNVAPYPTGPAGLESGSTVQYSSYGPPAQAPYPTGPGSAPGIGGNAPYPPGSGLGSAITSQPPYPTGSGYIPGPVSQPPYPVGSMPMPAPVDPQRQIGFTAPVTEEPKSSGIGFPVGGYPQQPGQNFTNGNQVGQQQGLIYPIESGGHEYVPQQYVPLQNGQQNPNTIYVVQKTPQESSSNDDCATLACCLASCYCLIECFKICADCDS